MDVEILSRIQFALTIMFHYIYPPLSIGLGVLLVLIEGMYVWTRDPHYKASAKFWSKVFALTFAIGVATGIVMEFEFGTNWAAYSRFVGDVFGSLLASEGIFAFFLESGFLALMLFGWDRVGARLHYFATWMVALGAHFSAIWIVVANSWMQTPAGYHLVDNGAGPRAEIVDFWSMVFNPSAMTRLGHTIIGAWLAGAFLAISISAYYLLKQRHQAFARTTLKTALAIALVACILQAFSGDHSAVLVARHQPSKLAALEGVYQTQTRAPLYLFGIPNNATRHVDWGIAVPGLLSYLSFGSVDAEIQGLDQLPQADWPKVLWVFETYHLMISMWVLMFLVTLWAWWALWRGRLEQNRWLLRIMVASVLFPQIANQAGWMSAEMGRYPWIVYNLLRISDGLSKTITAEQVFGSLVMFAVLYLALFLLFLYLLHHKIQDGPTDVEREATYKNLKTVARGLADGSDLR